MVPFKRKMLCTVSYGIATPKESQCNGTVQAKNIPCNVRYTLCATVQILHTCWNISAKTFHRTITMAQYYNGNGAKMERKQNSTFNYVNNLVSFLTNLFTSDHIYHSQRFHFPDINSQLVIGTTSLSNAFCDSVFKNGLIQLRLNLHILKGIFLTSSYTTYLKLL